MSATITARESARQARELAREFRALDRLDTFTPSEKAREIVKAWEKADARESLRQAAKDMGISANELASDIIAERTLIASELPAKDEREYEAGITIIESRERRSFVKGLIHAEHATRPDYRIARELVDTIGHDSGVVVSSLPTGTVKVNALYRAVNPEYANEIQARALVAAQKVAARIDAAEKAIENAPLKKGTPAMKKELADAQRAMVIARGRLARADKRVADSKAISADGIRQEFVAEFTELPGRAAIDSWELPAAIVRRPFRETIRPRIRRNPISPVECEVLRNEAKAEYAIIRAQVKLEVEKIMAENAARELVEKENARSAQKASRRMAETIRMRNARAAKKNAR